MYARKIDASIATQYCRNSLYRLGSIQDEGVKDMGDKKVKL